VQTQLQVMLDLQEAMNSRVHQHWREQGFEWYRAIWIECAELMDHYGWKWWKKQSLDNEQVKLELIDIWHFGLSVLLTKGVTAEEIAVTLTRSLSSTPAPTDFRLALETFAADSLTTQAFSIEKFSSLLVAIDLSFDDLYVGYVGKNILNFFRQEHGYKDGSYQKQWDGREDNEHLVDIVKTLDPSTMDFKNVLYECLEKRYQALCS
jgi:dimeric dUTPase (all-alpha-NTP-PPase superfamily)